MSNDKNILVEFKTSDDQGVETIELYGSRVGYSFLDSSHGDNLGLVKIWADDHTCIVPLSSLIKMRMTG